MQAFRNIKKPFIWLLSFWILIISTGFSVNYHYCQGQLKSWRINLTPHNCHVESACHKASPEKSCKHGEPKKGCCENDSSYVQLDTDFPTIDIATLDFEQIQLIIFTFVKRLLTLNKRPVYLTHYQNYKPPLLDRDIPIFIQSFLL